MPLALRRLQFEVEDTGSGIPQDTLHQIFDDFQQGKRRKARIEGTGLGLTISQKFVQLMGSELQVKSVEGEGSTFWFALELPEVIGAGKGRSASGGASSIIGYTGRRRVILIVDDLDENRALLKDILVPLGFDVLEAVGGYEAIEKAIQSLPDLIFMDVFMRTCDGFEATRRIREIPDLQDVKIIAISAGTYRTVRAKSLEAGCNDFLSKPFELDGLLDRLRTHLDLTWIYQHEDMPLPGDRHEQAETIIMPPQELIDELEKCARIGYVTGFEVCLDKIRQVDPQYTAFVTRITPLFDNFLFDELVSFIEEQKKKQ